MISKNDYEYLKTSIRDVVDFPQKGIVFKDITTLLNDKKAFNILIEHLRARYGNYNADFIVGVESRGFIFGATLAYALGVGFVPIRKPHKLPFTSISEKYSLEYGFDEVQIHTDAFRDLKNPRVIFCDDLIATGGTALASMKLIEKLGANLVEACFVIELGFLGGKEELSKIAPVYSVIEM